VKASVGEARHHVAPGIGELREAVLTGVFYPNTDSMTYTIGFEDYGTEKKIAAP